MEKKPIDKWINQGKKNCKSLVFYQNKVLDLSQFMLQHPGGVKAIKNYVYKDIKNIIFQVYPHNKATTLSKLMKYQVGFIITQEYAVQTRQKSDKTPLNSQRPKQKKKFCFISQNEKQQTNIKRDKSKVSMNKSVNKNRQGLRESTAKTNASKQTNKSKSKKKQFLTSIRIINQDQRKSYEDYYKQNAQKIKQRQKKGQKQRPLSQKRRDRKQLLESCSHIDNQLDQQKPNFKVPILNIKNMNKYI